MPEIEKSLTFLHDSIPQWFKDLDDIQAKIAHMQSEIAQLPSRPSMRRNTGSVESIRDLDVTPNDQRTTNIAQETPAAPLQRKPASLLSGQSFGPNKYRSRAMIVVLYDGQIQKHFETLVRSIGTGRNMLRKGKMAARMQAMVDLAGSDDDESEHEDHVMSKIQYRQRTGLSFMPGHGRSRSGTASTPEALFDSMDKTLEQAQGLCERAAHQALREGQCRKELDGMRRNFEQVLETTMRETAKYSAQKVLESQTPADSPTPLPTRRLTPPYARVPVDTKILLPSIPNIRLAPAMPTLSKTMDIEIDDDDDEGDFFMPPMRLTSRV